MDFASNINETVIGPGVSHPPIIAGFAVSEQFQSPLTIGISTLLAAIISFLAYQVYRPPVHPQSPAFTSDTIPIFGSFGFVTRQW
jgi:hypothetical protein